MNLGKEGPEAEQFRAKVAAGLEQSLTSKSSPV